jgi:RNA polymerase sigma factor (sigma-70 family)
VIVGSRKRSGPLARREGRGVEAPALERDREKLRDFDGFFREEFPRVVRAAALVARDLGAGQDAAQEAFVRLHARWGRMESSAHARNFVYRAAVNLSRSYLRKYLRVRPSGLRGVLDVRSPDPSPAMVEWLAIAQALARISPRQRACVVLVDYLGLDAAAAARTLRVRPSTVRVHLMRGRDELRQRLTEEGR